MPKIDYNSYMYSYDEYNTGNAKVRNSRESKKVKKMRKNS